MKDYRLMHAENTNTGKRAKLWWLNHYTYEIECDMIKINLDDTPYEKAELIFSKFIQEN